MRCSRWSRCGPTGPRSETSVGECGALLGGHRRDLVDLVGAEPGHLTEPTGEDDRRIAVFATAPAEVEQRIDRALELERRRAPIGVALSDLTQPTRAHLHMRDLVGQHPVLTEA